MIDAFNKYVNDYDMNDIDIKLKYNHSIRVMNLMVKYAKLLNFSEEDIEIAKIIGLLHDLGRFEQLRVYHTYVDKDSVDHADYSIEQLFEKGKIELFCDKKEWYPIIEFCIKNHNKHHLPECEDERVLKFAQLIRDIDKLDIIYLLGVLGELNTKVKDLEITKEVRDSVFARKTISHNDVKNYNDRIVVQLTFAFDIYNDIILKDYKEYLKAFYIQLSDDGRLKDIYNEVVKYIDERIENYERDRN